MTPRRAEANEGGALGARRDRRLHSRSASPTWPRQRRFAQSTVDGVDRGAARVAVSALGRWIEPVLAARTFHSRSASAGSNSARISGTRRSPEAEDAAMAARSREAVRPAGIPSASTAKTPTMPRSEPSRLASTCANRGDARGAPRRSRTVILRSGPHQCDRRFPSPTVRRASSSAGVEGVVWTSGTDASIRTSSSWTRPRRTPRTGCARRESAAMVHAVIPRAVHRTGMAS